MRRGLRVWSVVLAAIGLLPMTVGAADDAVASTGDAAAAVKLKTHTLFMGFDIDVQQDKSFYRVENVTSDSFIIKVNDKPVKIPTRFNPVGMKFKHQLKLAETSANVAKWVVERSYTPGNDPTTKFVASLGAGAADAQLSNDSTRLTALMLASSRAANNPNSPLGGPVAMITGVGDNPGELSDQIAQAERSYNASAHAMQSDFNSAGHSAGTLQQELDEKMFDALDITFEVSADKPLIEPYAVIFAQFSEKGAKPTEVQNWVFATELGQITSEVRRIRIKRGGFPRGFELKSYQLHLYNRGHEIATTVADKRVELTRDEAFQYLLIDYLHLSKGKTLPPTLALGHLPASVRNTLPSRTVYVTVTKDGRPVAAFSDESCTQKIENSTLAAELQELRFKPALEKGKAVTGVAQLNSF